jgi:hypothetical protein
MSPYHHRATRLGLFLLAAFCQIWLGLAVRADIIKAPSNLTATAVSSTQINLSWIDNSQGELGTRIERAPSSAGPWTLVGTVGQSVTSYANTGLTASIFYSYRVQTYDSAGVTAYSNTASATTRPSTTDLPPSVTIRSPLNGTIVSGTVTVSATAADTDSTGVSRIDLYCDSTLISSVSSSSASASYNTTGVGNGSHTFVAKAYDTAGNSSSANSVVTVSNSIPNGSGTEPGPWAKGFGGANNDSGQAIAVDSSGNIYMAGYFYGTANFGGSTLSSAGGYDLVLAKYNNAGVHQWSYRFGGAGDEIATSIALDGFGNIFVGGYFTGTGNLGGNNLVSAGQQDCFLAKYSASGAPVWSMRMGGASPDVINAVATDSQGNVVVTGYFQAPFSAPVDFGGTTLYSVAAGIDTFLAKYSGAGQLLFAKDFTNSGADYGTGIAVDKRINPTTGLAYDNIVLCGYFTGYIDFGGGQLSTPGGYIAKFSPTGAYIWEKAYGINNAARFWTLALDSNGDVVVSGDFSLHTDLGGGTINGTAISDDMFVAKYSGANGSYLWAQGILGTSFGRPTSITTDAQNNVLLTGYFNGTYHLGSYSVTTGIYAADDGFVAKYSSAGGAVWAQRFGSSNEDNATSVAVDPTGHAVVTGFFSGTGTFPPNSVTSVGANDSFILRLNP